MAQRRLHIIGNGGHARQIHSMCINSQMYGPSDQLPLKGDVIIGVGELSARIRLYGEFEKHRFVSVVHKCDLSRDYGHIGHGVVLMPGSIVNAGAHIGDNVIVNTGAQVDHDCYIGDHCILSPGSILCGGVKLGMGCQIGAGAIIVQGVELDEGTTVPAGTLVVSSDDMRRPVRSK